MKPGEVDTSIPFSTVLPICEDCIDEGAKVPVRSAKRLSNAKAQRCANALAREAHLAAKRAKTIT